MDGCGSSGDGGVLLVATEMGELRCFQCCVGDDDEDDAVVIVVEDADEDVACSKGAGLESAVFTLPSLASVRMRLRLLLLLFL
jgi:uncharacterized membrane protein YgcG